MSQLEVSAKIAQRDHMQTKMLRFKIELSCFGGFEMVACSKPTPFSKSLFVQPICEQFSNEFRGTSQGVDSTLECRTF